jgi:lysophospholipase L1-like esterase
VSAVKTILAFGDSLTFGTDAVKMGRHAREDRWPSVLAAGLGADVEVIAEGLGGRTTAFDDHTAAADRNGARVLPTLLSSHAPLDAVVIMLGSNDLKPFVSGSAKATTAGMRRLVQIVQTHPYGNDGGVPAVVIVSPPHFGPSDQPGGGPAMDRDIEESRRLAPLYELAAKETGALFFDAATVAKVDRVDGVHLDAANTRAIGAGLVPVLRKVLGL